jgi:hypothetical protein
MDGELGMAKDSSARVRKRNLQNAGNTWAKGLPRMVMDAKMLVVLVVNKILAVLWVAAVSLRGIELSILQHFF